MNAIAAMRRLRPVAAICIVVAACVAAALVQVYVHLQVIHVGYDLSKESKIHHELGEQNQKLRLELAVRKDPAVIERRAREELGMTPPDPRLLRVLQVPRDPRATAVTQGGR